MNKRLGNARLEWYDVELLFWGSIVPPETEDIAKKPWLWDVWGTGPRGQKQQPYLDIGASGLYVRKFWVTQLFVQENYTSGTTSGLHGGFCSQVSGLYPASGFNLATKDYVDYQISIIPIPSGGSGSTSLSGLTDVSGIWSSGTVVSWNGLYFVPATTTGVANSGNWEISGTSAALNATLPGRFAASGALFGNGTSGTLPVYDGLGHLTDSIVSQFDLGTNYGLNISDPYTGASAVLLPDFYSLGFLRIYSLPPVTVGFGSFLVGSQVSGIPGAVPYYSEAALISNSDWRFVTTSLLSGITLQAGTITVRGQDTDVRYALSGTGSGSTTLSGLTDIQFQSALVSGHILGWNGTKWTNTGDQTGVGDSDQIVLPVQIFS